MCSQHTAWHGLNKVDVVSLTGHRAIASPTSHWCTLCNVELSDAQLLLIDDRGVGRVIENNYILLSLITLLFFIFPNFQTFYFLNKGISSITSSVHKETAEETTKETNTYNSFKLENCPPRLGSILQFYIYFRNHQKITFKRTALL